MHFIQRIAVVGAGTMGEGIALVCAVAGFEVLLYDTRTELANRALVSIRKNLEVSAAKKKIATDAVELALARITAVQELQQLKVDLVIEAVVEQLDIKQALLKELERINTRECILTTNTSSLSVREIAKTLNHPERFAGLHFFNPAHLMRLVEIVEIKACRADVILTLQNLMKRLNKIAVIVKDSPGFLVNRVARPYYLEALKLLEEGTADFQTIDKLLTSAGFKLGPFELMDLIGIDVNFAVTNSIYNAFNKEPRFQPSAIQQQKVGNGELGKKSGRGFYTYSDRLKA